MTVEGLLSRVRMVTAPEQGNLKQEAASAVAGIALTALLYSQTSQWITGRRLASMPLRFAAMTLPPAVTLAAREVANRGMAAYEAYVGKTDPAKDKRDVGARVAELQEVTQRLETWVTSRPKIEDSRWTTFKEAFEPIATAVRELKAPADGMFAFLSRKPGVDDLLRSQEGTTDA
jgi:hypothetical protein